MGRAFDDGNAGQEFEENGLIDNSVFENMIESIKKQVNSTIKDLNIKVLNSDILTIEKCYEICLLIKDQDNKNLIDHISCIDPDMTDVEEETANNKINQLMMFYSKKTSLMIKEVFPCYNDEYKGREREVVQVWAIFQLITIFLKLKPFVSK